MVETQEKTLKSVIAEMLVENTGRHMLDSGGAYGRHWEKNSKAAADDPVAFFEAQPDAYWGNLSIYPNENFRKEGDKLSADFYPVINVYHFLTEKLADYNAEMDAALHEFAETDAMKDAYWLEIMEAFPEHWAQLVARKRAEEEAQGFREDLEADEDPEAFLDSLAENFYVAPTGFYGDGNCVTDNSYNHEDFLSQVIQFTYFEHDGESYVLLQIHGGCDVRGGYTEPRAFDCGTYSEMEIFDYSNASVYCTNDDCTARWYTYGNSGWDNDEGLPDLNTLDAMEGTWVEAKFLRQELMERFGKNATLVIEERGEYGRDSILNCPVCGEGHLKPSLY